MHVQMVFAALVPSMRSAVKLDAWVWGALAALRGSSDVRGGDDDLRVDEVLVEL
jgi:hypothetical protein